MDPDTGEATDDLQPQVIRIFEKLGSTCTTVSQVIKTRDKAVFKAVQEGINRYNNYQNIFDIQKVL